MRRSKHPLRVCSALALAATCGVLTPQRAEAFCGFYVSGAEQKLYDDATGIDVPTTRGCGRCDVNGGPGSLAAILGGALLGLLRRRRGRGGPR
ncbi:MAG: hypothetical protein JNL82_25035 [Myxococcales bacterium]|nr:hypothetical protein [Myxococcales bacterium]